MGRELTELALGFCAGATHVNGQQKILVGGQQFSLPADSSSPSGRTAELHAGGQQFSKWADGAVPEDSRWLGVGARSKIA
ncbi:MAG TPA: hypothetical protein VMU64_00065 [Acidimicrobiales bacterium]|nr:hypothetical protein [Acidimicrobiales bacterium]